MEQAWDMNLSSLAIEYQLSAPKYPDHNTLHLLVHCEVLQKSSDSKNQLCLHYLEVQGQHGLIQQGNQEFRNQITAAL